MHVCGRPAAGHGVSGTCAVECFDRHFYAHPLVCFHRDHPDGGTHRLSDALPLAGFQRTSLYAEYYRRIGIEYVVAVPLHVDAGVLVSVVLNRSGRDFSSRELALLDAVRAPLVTLYRHARMADHAAALQASLRAQVGAGTWHEIEVDGRSVAVTADGRGTRHRPPHATRTRRP